MKALEKSELVLKESHRTVVQKVILYSCKIKVNQV